MRTERKPPALIALVSFVVLACIACGTSIVAETTNPGVIDSNEVPTDSINPGEGVNSPDTTDIQTSTSTTNDVKGSTSTMNSTTTFVTVTTILGGALSPAWIEAQALDSSLSAESADNLEDTRFVNDYYSTNPNDISTPMGALCWAYHELDRSITKDGIRHILDEFTVPIFMEHYGVASEQFGPPGPDTTSDFLKLVSGDNGPVGSTGEGSDVATATPGVNGDVGPVGSTDENKATTDDYIEYLRILHEFAGDGTAWSTAIRTIASPEMTSAFKAGNGLPADLQVYADALIAFAKEHIGIDMDHTAESDNLDFALPGFPGLETFVKTAKYHQDCQRAQIQDL